MFEIPSPDQILPEATEACRRFNPPCSPAELAKIVAENWNDCDVAAGAPLIRAAATMATVLWYLRRDRRRAARDLDNGWPFAAFQLFAEHSCERAKARHGELYERSADLPVLPFEGCSAPFCKCAIQGLSHREVERIGSGRR